MKDPDYVKKKELIREAKKNGCVYCHEKEMACLEMHHLNELTKKLNLGQFNSYPLSSLQTEIAKCICVCANCHKKIHANIL